MIGIYKITSPNNKLYIGQSWDILDRWSDYKGLRRNSIGRRFYNSLLKHGPENFIYEVVQECNEDISQSELDNLEIKYELHFLDRGYVLLNSRGCGGSTGKHSAETKVLMSQASKGRNKSEEHKKALSEAKLKKPTTYWKGKTFSEEHKKKLCKPKSVPNPRKGIPTGLEVNNRNYVVEENGEIKRYFTSKKKLIAITGVSFKTLNKLLSGKVCKKLKREIKIWEDIQN